MILLALTRERLYLFPEVILQVLTLLRSLFLCQKKFLSNVCALCPFNAAAGIAANPAVGPLIADVIWFRCAFSFFFAKGTTFLLLIKFLDFNHFSKNSYYKGTKLTVEQQFPLEAICMIYRTYEFELHSLRIILWFDYKSKAFVMIE
jgi:hypothetical protein